MVARDLQNLMLEMLSRRSIGFYSNNVGGKLVSDAIDYPDTFNRLSDAVVTSFVPLAITLFVGSLVIYVESWQLGLCVTTMTVLVVGLGVRDSRRMAPRRKERISAKKATTAHLADTITNIQTVKTFSHEDRELGRQKTLSERLAQIRIRDWHEMSVRGNSRLFVLVVLQIVLMYLIIHLVQRDPSLLGVGIFAFTFTITLSTRLFEVNMLIRNVEESLLQASPMTQVIYETPEIKDIPGALPLQVAKGAIDFSKVTFAYDESRQQDTVFTELDVHIAAGEKVGLVGPSGGGKTTLTKLLLRFDDVLSGIIEIDGQDIAKITQQSLRQSIAYVPQEPLLFHRTIAENIGYGKLKATRSDIEHAARLAHADDFISQLQHGYDTVVGERGVKLSGGQRQRIAIARAMLKDAPILVLDEATSALDSESEVLIQQALWELMRGRTAVVVAHRLSTIQKMDRIVVLDGGRIIEQGTHRQLIKRKGLYAKLWAHQSGGFMEV
jgi:ATP-binding cassette subfamily B protein